MRTGIDLGRHHRDRHARARRGRRRTATSRSTDELMDASAAYFKAERGPDAHRGPASRRTTATGRWPRSSSPSTPAPRPGHPALSSERDRRRGRRPRRRADPVRLGRPAPRRRRRRRARGLVDEHGVRGFKFHPSLQGFEPERHRRTTRSTRRCRSSACSRCSTPARPASARACPAGAGSSCATPNPMLLDDVAADFPDLHDHHGAPLGAVAGRGASRSRRTRRNMCIDLSGWSPEVLPRRSSCAPRLATRSTRCCSARTSRCSRPTGGCATSTTLDAQARGQPG